MQIDNCRVYNFENAFRGMRNPLNSWGKSDSVFGLVNANDYDPYIDEVALEWTDYDGYEFGTIEYDNRLDEYVSWLALNGTVFFDAANEVSEIAYIGPHDMELATKLAKAGPEHRKFLRQIFVSMDITAPLYWWKEMDTYKVATAANSTSTMHTLASKPITLDCFELDDITILPFPKEIQPEGLKANIDEDFIQMCLIPYLEYLRSQYVQLKTTDPKRAKVFWKELVRWLPNGWLQTRTWTCSYETLRAIYHQRENHKLVEWHKFLEFIKRLPYAQELIMS